MKTYRVGIWEEQGGYVNIQAKSKEDAIEKVEELLASDGVNAFDDFDVTHRNTDITDEPEKIS